MINSSVRRHTDILIIGGGIIGCAIAYYLRKSGREVLVCEQGTIGAQASSAAAGLLAPLGPLSGPGPFADLLLAGYILLPAVAAELEEYTGLRLGYARTGALRVVRNPKRVAHLRKRMEAWRPLGLELHWLSGDEARQYEPQLAPDICAAVYAPQESQIQANALTTAFAQAARQMGAHLYEHTTITGLLLQDARVTGVCTAQEETIACQHLVIATGAWAGQCAEWLHVTLPVTPLHGQMLLLAQPTHPLHTLIFGEALYLVPRGEAVLVGATKDEVGFETRVTDEGIDWLRATAARLVPALQESALLKIWAGLRPRTPDTRPMLGPVAGWENVTLATGHNSVGIMLSAITGQLIAVYLLTGSLPALLQPFVPARFQ